MTDNNTLLQILLGAAFVALAGLAWHNRGPNLDDAADAHTDLDAEVQAHSDALEAKRQRRSGEDRRVNDQALPYIGDGYDRRQRTRRQPHA